MAHFDRTTLKHLERLSRIRCLPEEEEELLARLSRVLTYIDQLNEVDTEQTVPCSYVLRGMLKTVLRPDEVQEPLPHTTFLQNAPDQVGGMIRIPPVMKPQ